tara:strand:- start:1428 stop:2393 length:966 start_codon:yes stop_codon:yes gene_type:complete
MGTISKISNISISNISKFSGISLSGIDNIDGQGLFSNTQSLSHGTANSTDAVYAASTDSDFQLIQTDAWSVSFWIKVGWTSSVNMSCHLIASDGGSVHNNMWRVYYNETNNRLYFGFRSANTYKSNNFWYFHHTGAGEAGAQSGLGTSYPSDNWMSSNPGYVNADGFTLITITKGTDTKATRANVTAYWNGQNLGDAYWLNGCTNNCNTPAMNASTTRNFAIGNNSWNYGSAQGGDGVPSLYDEVALWDKELNSTEVLEIWNGADPPVLGDTTGTPTNLQTSSMVANLIGYWRFETNGTVSTVGSATLTLDGSSTTSTTHA